jgi:hypothetical protein
LYKHLHKKPKLLVIGHGRHGKDTVGEILKNMYNFSFESSSRYCSKHFIFDKLKDKYGYLSEEECYLDRINHRTEWYTEIAEYNKIDPGKLGREIFQKHDVYCGLRRKKEFNALKNEKVFTYVIWVDRSEHLPLEPVDSMNLQEWMADFTIDNNGSIQDLHFNVAQLMRSIIV